MLRYYVHLNYISRLQAGNAEHPHLATTLLNQHSLSFPKLAEQVALTFWYLLRITYVFIIFPLSSAPCGLCIPPSLKLLLWTLPCTLGSAELRTGAVCFCTAAR